MEFIFVIGWSASGKTTLIEKIKGGDVLVRESMRISPNSHVGARLSDFGRKGLCYTSADSIAESLTKLPLDVVLMKWQLKHGDDRTIDGDDIIKKLAKYASKSDSIRLVILFPSLDVRAGWYRKKYKKTLTPEEWKSRRECLLKRVQDIKGFVEANGVKCSLEIRNSAEDYKLLPQD